MTASKSPSESTAIMTRFTMPTDANIVGNVFGGSIMKLIDEIASVCAVRHSRMNIVTASIDRMDFYSPVYVGDMLILRASLNYVGKSSMEVGVKVEAENPLTGEVRHTGTCFLTYVALDSHGKPVEVPRLKPETEEERRRFEEAKQRRKRRLQEIGRQVTES